MQRLFEDLHAAILNNDVARIKADLKNNDGEKRFAIYAEGYRLRLQEALKADYPALLSVLGNTAFEEQAQHYIEHHAPTGYNLDTYPQGFAKHLLPDDFASNLAKLESYIAIIFMAEESEAIPLSVLHKGLVNFRALIYALSHYEK